MKIILDNGHGRDTAGKASPVWGDGTQLREWEFNRDIVNRIATRLKEAGITPMILVPEADDIALDQRCARVNRIAKQYNGKVMLISVHGNAGGGSGWECYTSVGETASDRIASRLCAAFSNEFSEQTMRFDYTDGDPDKESQFYLLRHTVCPAVLTENFFMDTERDCRLMMSDNGRDRIARAHVEAILAMMAEF